MKKFFIILLFNFFFINISNAEIINEINVTGNKRISDQSIILFSKFKKKSNLDNEGLNIIIKNLYETNFFSDVQVNYINNQLNILVVENPIIQSIIFEGLKAEKFKTQIYEILTLKEKSSFIKNTSQDDVFKIKNIMKRSGYYFSKVELSIQENNNNTVNLIYDIDLGEKAVIKKIKFIGDKKFSDNKLRKIITSEESKFWKFVSKNKYLDENRIELDERLLKNFYINKGYYNVEIKKSFAKFVDSKDFELNYNVQSGNKYFFNSLKLDLPPDFNLNNFVKINKKLDTFVGNPYSYTDIEKILKEIELIALNDQYKSINASIDEAIVSNNKINLTISIKDTKKFLVQRIDVTGNNITNENVIRNLFILDEGDTFNEILLSKSINNIKSLSIFGSVNQTVVDGPDPTSKIIKVEVEEKPTGEISAGAGVGSSGGSVALAIKENNYQGKGIRLNTNLQISEESLKGQFIYSQPNFNYSDKDLNLSLQSVVTDRLASNGYKNTNSGFSVGTGYEQYDDIYFRPTLSLELDDLTTSSSASANLKKQTGSYVDTNFSYEFDLDKRNQKYRASSGYRQQFFQELPLIADSKSLTNSYQFTKYTELISDLRTTFGFFAKSITTIGNDDVRISKRLLMPASKLRGFESGKVGPVDNKDHVGGNYISTFNITSELPALSSELQNIDFKLFFDAANIWGVDYNKDKNQSSKIRSSAGLGVDWYTVIGPLSFSISQPISKESTDVTETFRFNLGTTF
jgi:outer membrane protein insertion porin family